MIFNFAQNPVIRRIFLLITLVILCGISSKPLSAFYDISQNDPQKVLIDHLRDVGVMKGFTDGHFYPKRNVSRAEGLVIAMRAGRIQVNNNYITNAYYGDVDPNQWYANWIKRGVDVGIIKSKSNNFRPSDPITKAEFLTFLFRSTAVQLKRYQHKSGIALDVPKDAWFSPFFAYAKRYQIAHLPSDNFYHPEKLLNRREVAMMTYRQLKIFHGGSQTKVITEMQASMQQFIELTRNKKYKEAEKFLPKILSLNEALARKNNGNDAFVANMMSTTMQHFTESLRAFRNGKTLKGIEYLHLSLKHVEKLQKEGSPKMQAFSAELKSVISETLIAFVEPEKNWYGMK